MPIRAKNAATRASASGSGGNSVFRVRLRPGFGALTMAGPMICVGLGSGRFRGLRRVVTIMALHIGRASSNARGRKQAAALAGVRHSGGEAHRLAGLDAADVRGGLVGVRT